ncbi:YCF48-related protein [Winogradskyella poriferorum]|uniref:YCF48-related protein n=1 Tax=Winogradskyella poriferorum TaxID=307627 RepID=UPI003D661753
MRQYYFNSFLFLIINIGLISPVTAQWDVIDINTTNNLYDVHFIDKDTGWIAGDNTVYKTVDAGINWTAYNSAVTDTRYYGIYFIDQMNGWAVGKKKTASTAGRVHYTTDGGETWQVYFTGGSLPWWSVAFNEEGTNGIMVGQEGQSLFTTDGGTTWFPRTLPSGDAGIIKDVTFIDDLTAIAVGYDLGLGVVMKTTDGGSSWTNIITDLEGRLDSVSFSNFLDGIAVGSSGKIYKTSDGGNTWIEKSSNTASTLNGVKYFDENRAIAVGTGGIIVGSHDNGETWAIEQTTSDFSFTLRGVDKGGVATTFAVGAVGAVIKDNCVQSGTIVFEDNTASPFISPDLTIESKIYFYYNIIEDENTPPTCTIIEEFIVVNGEVFKMGCQYLGNGLLQMWMDFSFEESPLSLSIPIPDSLTQDGISINFDETSRPPNFNIDLGIRQDVNESINVFAGGSAGAEIILGGVAVGPAQLAISKIGLSGGGGMGLKFENDLSGNQVITRRFERGAGISVEFPSINLVSDVLKGTPKASISFKGMNGQSLKFTESSDNTKKAKAAFILETLGIGGIKLSPFAGAYITALKNSLIDLNPDLSQFYSTYHNSTLSGANAEGSISLDFNFELGNTKYNFLEASASASFSSKKEIFTNNLRTFEISHARAFNVSTLNFKVLNDAVDFGNLLSFEVGGEMSLSGTFNTLTNQTQNLSLSFKGSASPQISPLQLSTTREYKFIIPENVIANNSVADNIIGVASDLLTIGNSNKTFNAGFESFTGALDINYENNPSSLGDFEEHNLLEVNETDIIGITDNIGIDLGAAVGVGVGISLGFEYSYISESTYLQSQYIVANDTILPVFENTKNLNNLITLSDEITTLYEGTTLLLDDAFDELITVVQEPIQDGVDFVVDIGNSAAELTGNLISDGEQWILRLVNPEYTISFDRGPLINSQYGRAYISEVNSSFTNTSKLYIVSDNLNVNLLDINDEVITTFDPVSLSMMIDQEKIDALGFSDTEKALAKLYKFDETSLTWIELSGDNNPDLDFVETSITEAGNYAIGINYNTASDLSAPEIPDFFPTEGSIIPSIDEHWAELFEPVTGVGLDLSQTIIKIDDVEVPILWDPVNERILYTPEIALVDGPHTFEVIVKDLNGNTNSIFSNYTVDSSLSVDDISDIDKFKIFPIPAQDILKIKGNLSIIESVEIYNIDGQFVKRITNNYESIDIQNLSSGLYFARISTSSAFRVVKIIKQ